MDSVTGTHIKSATESGDLGASVSCDTTALSINPSTEGIPCSYLSDTSANR